MEIPIKTNFNALHFNTAMFSCPSYKCFTCHTELFDGLPSLSQDYDHSNYGHQHNDSSNALSHAAGLLSFLLSLLRQKGLNADFADPSFQEPLLQLTQDYRNFMQCFQLGTATEWNGYSPKEIAYDFTETMFYFGLFSAGYFFLQPFYADDFLASEHPTRPEDFPDFYDLILRAADFLLYYQDSNIGFSFMFYQMLSSSTNVPFEGFTDADKATHSHWKEQGNIYLNILCSSEVTQNFSKTSAYLVNIRELFNQLLPNSNRDILQQNTFDALDQFFSISTDSFNKNERREYFLMANVLLQHYIIFLLYLLWTGPASLQKKEMPAVFDKRPCLLPYPQLFLFARKFKEPEADYLRLLDYAAVSQISRFLLHSLSADDSIERICYYTSLNNLAFMFPDQCKDDKVDLCGKLTIMHLSYMNDPNEGKMLQNALYKKTDFRTEMERQDVSVPYVFLKSFSPHLDYLPMWEMYGGKAQGCCVVLDWKKSLADSTAPEVPLYRVCYLRHANNTYHITQTDNPELNDLPQFRKWFSQLRKIARKSGIDRKIFNQLLGALLYLFKDSSYSYEREYRIIYAYPKAPSDKILLRTAQTPPKFFVQPDFHVQIDELILGPKFQSISDHIPYLQRQLEEMAEKTGKDVPKITLSNIDYR